MAKTLFLPGAAGSADFWKPAARAAGLEGVFLSWPGLGLEPARPGIASLDDLTALAAREVGEPVDILAQSMGGVIALRLALAFPRLVRRLVLAVTSGGLPVTKLGGADWRADYAAAFPGAARWIADPVPDLSDHLPGITAPTLLLWGMPTRSVRSRSGRGCARSCPRRACGSCRGQGTIWSGPIRGPLPRISVTIWREWIRPSAGARSARASRSVRHMPMKLSRMLRIAGPISTTKSAGRMKSIIGTVIVAGRRPAFSSARSMRSVRCSWDRTL